MVDNIVQLAPRKQSPKPIKEIARAFERARADAVTGVTGRDHYIVTQALAYAIEIINSLPERRREESNKRDMQKLLASLMPDEFWRNRLLDGARARLFGREP